MKAKELVIILLITTALVFIGCSDSGGDGGGGGGDDTPIPIPGFEWIKAGTFTMGSSIDTDPDRGGNEDQHPVTLTKGFYMSKYQVTQKEYLDVMESNPSYFTTSPEGNPDKLPVEQVNWYHAIAFCNRLSILAGLTPVYTVSGISNTDAEVWKHSEVPTGNNTTWNDVEMNYTANGYRLPTEAEWEYACRAGKETAFSYGDTANGDYMWYSANSDWMTHEVGKKLPNAWGLYDMHGNVYEWCWDWYAATYEGSTDPEGPATGADRVFRGGCWGHGAQYARSAYRDSLVPGSRYYHIGFRLVRR